MVQRQKPGEPPVVPLDPLADRVSTFLERQLAWYDCVLDDLASAESQFDEQEPDAIEARRAVYTSDIADQERQLKALLAEWQDGQKPAPADVQRIRALASRVEERAARAAGELQRTAAGMGARAEEVRRNLETLRNGRRAFRGYRLLQPDSGLLDEKG